MSAKQGNKRKACFLNRDEHKRISYQLSLLQSRIKAQSVALYLRDRVLRGLVVGKQGMGPTPAPSAMVPGQQEGGQLTTAMLAAASPEQQKQMLGERLFPLVMRLQGDLAGKITGAYKLK